uniref:HEAT repeat-containing protein 2 n=2 Tax=Mesocestoides corti TaxID=53468 RepID=A0A5K3FUN3_MESCO
MVFRVTDTSRVITLLSSDSKLKRRDSLVAIELDFEENLENATVDDVKDYCSRIIPHLVNSITDPVESHREKSLRILSKLCERVDASDCFLPYVTQVFVKSLASKESLEISEEIRLCSLKLLHQILLKLRNGACYVADFCLILQYALEDNFHEVKIVCCDLLRVLATKFSSSFYHSAEPVLKPLLKNVVHQQHRVRVATVEAAGVVFKHCNGKFVDYTIAPLTQRLFDPSPAVRQAVVKVVGDWLLNLIDRYSYHAKLIPLILSGKMDESEDIRVDADSLWHDIGLKFQKENENDLKDKIDFDLGKPEHYPPNQTRPNLGCRELIGRNASRLLPGLCNDLRDWQEETRRKAAGLLPILLLHLEAGVTQHTQLLVSGLATGIGDAILRATSATSGASSLHLILMAPKRQLPCLSGLFVDAAPGSKGAKAVAPSLEAAEALRVMHFLFTAARYTSCFVSPKVWWKLLHENARRCFEATSPTSLAGNYFLLANLIAGSSLESLVTSEGSTDAASGDALVCPLLRVTAFLTAEEQISCSAFASKAGLLECANAVTCVLADLVERHQQAQAASGDGTVPEATPSAGWSKVAMKLIEDTFCLLLAMSASWEQGAERTDFAVEFNDAVGRLLCHLARHRSALSASAGEVARCPTCEQPQDEPMDLEAKEALVIAAAKRSGLVLERLYGSQLPQLLRRLDEARRNGDGWHAKSVGLSIFCHAVLSAGPGILTDLEPACRCCCKSPPPVPVASEDSCLLLTLRLLENGCKLNQPLDVKGRGDDDGKSPNPMCISAEAELHLRGLLLLIRLTEHARVRLILTQPKLFRYCLTKLILPSCVWRAGRTAEAMRKAAATSLVALLAAVVPLRPPSKREGDTPTHEAINRTEGALDDWVNQRVAPTKGKLTELLGKNGLMSRRVRLIEPPPPATKGVADTRQLANLGLVSAASPRLLSLLLARLGGLLTDDVEATRLLACTGLALLFGGIYSGGSEEAVGSVGEPTPDQRYVPGAFLRSPAWFLPLLDTDGVEEVDIEGYGDKMPGLTTPLPGSLGDKVYKFYPCLLKALDDASDEVRLRAADVFVTWFWVMAPNLTERPPPVAKTTAAATAAAAPPPTEDSKSRCINPVFSSVFEDLCSSIVVHLDDSDGLIRAAVARIVLRMAQLSPATVQKVLSSARERHRSPELCEALLETLNWTCI